MEFKNRVLTNSGKNLIAQATSARRIVFLKALATEAYLPREQLVDLTPASLANGTAGVIKTAAATKNVARIVVEYTNIPTAATFKTIALLAKLESDDDASAVVIAALSDPEAAVYVPSTSDLQTSVQIAFNIAISADDTVEVTPAAGVSLGDFERLMERTVTTHADAQPTVGDPTQQIYGAKNFRSVVSFVNRTTFTSQATFNGGISNNGNFSCAGTSSVDGDAFFGSGTTFDGDVKCLADIDVDGSVACGALKSKGKITGKDADVESIAAQNIYSPTINCTIDPIFIIIKSISAGNSDNAFDILREICTDSDGVIREAILACSHGVHIALARDPRNFEKTSLYSVLTLNCPVADAIETMEIFPEAYDYTTVPNSKIGQSVIGAKDAPFGEIHATKLFGTLETLLSDGIGALVHLKLSLSGRQTSVAETAILPRGTVIQRGHTYDSAGVDMATSPTGILQPLIDVVDISLSDETQNTQQFALLEKVSFSVPRGTENTSYQADVWAIRVG